MNSASLPKQLLSLLGILLASWILVHFVAVFGLFLALAYPLLELFFPLKIACFWCGIKHSPHLGSHLVINSLLLVLLSAFSLGVVWLETRALHYLGIPTSRPTVNFVIPGRSQHKIGEIFPFKIQITGIAIPINVVQADLSFDPAKLEVVDITTESSLATIFLQKDFSNTDGYVRVTGGIPNPGYNEATGFIGTVYLRGRIPGLAQLSFLDSSLVLANDGRGTNVLKGRGSIDYLILPEAIAPAAENSSANLTIQDPVLGETASTNLEFYEYTQNMPPPAPQILGEAIGPSLEPAPTSAPISLPNILAQFLSQIDQAILNFWQRILCFVANSC